MAVGRDAADVAITTSFGAANLKGFVEVADPADEVRITIPEALIDSCLSASSFPPINRTWKRAGFSDGTIDSLPG